MTLAGARKGKDTMHDNPSVRLLVAISNFERNLTEQANCRHRGFTLVELMIVVAVIAIILTMALPTYYDYVIRSKIGEGLSVANAAVTATASACQEDLTLVGLTNNAAGYSFEETEYVSDIIISGACSEPVVTIYTRNTGAPDPQPEITITGQFLAGQGRVSWECASSNTPNQLLPSSCRS